MSSAPAPEGAPPQSEETGVQPAIQAGPARQTTARLGIRATLRRVLAAAREEWTRARRLAAGITLRSFRPDYVHEAHGSTVDLLLAGLDGADPAQNIAVSGPYGSGKSSVLLGLRQRLSRKRVVEIALATSEQATAAIMGSNAAKSKSSPQVTEALQKEIVKRLLYADKAAKLPRSRLSRIRGVDWPRTLWISVAGALVVGAAAWVYDFPAPFAHLFSTWLAQNPDAFQPWAWAARVLDGFLVGGLFLALQWGLSYVPVREVSVGEFKFSRGDPTQNYFDQYLDEIVYFFARTKTRVVVFEDLDRFNNRDIFIAVRELNVLLNNSDAVKQPVSFVYAIRDSLFNPTPGRTGPEGVAAAAADRTKFFDLVVPVVPFISVEVSGGLLADELAALIEAERPDAGLVRIGGRYFPDMRVLRSIGNEYDLYLDRLVRNGKVSLDPSHLFAMVLYKHAYPDDYERIQFGKSKLDTLLANIETSTAARLAGLDREIAEARDSRDQGARAAARAAEAGVRLRAVLAVAASAAAATGRRQTVAQITVGGGSPRTPEEAGTVEFWRELDAIPAGSMDLTLAPSSATVTIPVAALRDALPSDLPAEQWLGAEASADEERLGDLVRVRRALRHASLSDRLSDREYPGLGVSTDGTAIQVDFVRVAE